MKRALSHRHLAGFDEYIELLQGWQSEAVQLSRGVVSLGSEMLVTDGFTLKRLQFDREVLFRSVCTDGWYALVVDLSPKTWCGLEVASGSVRAISPGRETTTISHGSWDSIAINVRRDVLAGWNPRVAEGLDRDKGVECSQIDFDKAALERFVSWVEDLFRDPMSVCTDGELSLWMTALRDRAGHLAVKMVGDNPHSRRVSMTARVARYDLVMAVLDIVHKHDHDHDRITILDLATRLGVGVRAIEYAFSIVVGLSPAQYLLAERLTRARNRLRNASLNGVSVTKVAFDHQFENLSRFAFQYTRLFGELPSCTLRTARDALHKA